MLKFFIRKFLAVQKLAQEINLGKPGYATAVEDLLPDSAALPERVFSPNPKDEKPEKYAWEED